MTGRGLQARDATATETSKAAAESFLCEMCGGEGCGPGEDARRCPICKGTGHRTALDLIRDEIARQNKIHPDGYPATRDGVRFGIATAEDELREALEAWRIDRAAEGWPDTLTELVQAAAVIARTSNAIIVASVEEELRARGAAGQAAAANGDSDG